ncbi:Uncaracterized surface protein containing fasciclin (FAS1) repeats [Pedobacter sp. ok626]|nr:Uncaracterized surface protein containing fasciclin (FAS1) repeats [Pedobacter sp. ok626]
MTLSKKYMIGNTTRFLIMMLVSLSILTACKDSWEERGMVSGEGLTLSLMDRINADANLSLFSAFLTKTGYAEVINSSKNYTIWAPTNAALQNLDASIVNDSLKLKSFVANHISNLTYATSVPADTAQRILMLNGKYIPFTKTTFDDATISTANQYAKNGILHVISAAVPVRLSIWEYLNSTTSGLNQKNYLLSLNKTGQDTTLATVIGYDPATGKPILKPGTGLVTTNRFLTSVQNVSNEQKQYTFFLLTDAAYSAEQAKLNKYYYTTSLDVDSTTANLTSWNLVKDLAVSGAYSLNALPSQLISVNNVKIPIDKNAIVASYKASNGWVYVMNSMNFAVSEKIPPITVEGENVSSFSAGGASGNIFYPIRSDYNGVSYKSLEVYRLSISGFTANYRLRNIPSATYKVYWRSIAGTTGDPQAVTFNQKVTFYSSNILTDLGYKPVSVASTDPIANALAYSERYLGDCVVSKYGNVTMSLIAAASTSVNVNTLLLDYVKLVPVIQ